MMTMKYRNDCFTLDMSKTAGCDHPIIKQDMLFQLEAIGDKSP
jgi:hypothetical protein